MFEKAYKQFHSIMEAGKVPSASLVISHQGKVQYDAHTLTGIKKLTSAETLFPIASCSKIFAGTVLAILVQDQKCHFDDLLIKHFPQLRIHSKELTEKIRLTDLICHKLGLADDGDEVLDHISMREGYRAMLKHLAEWPVITAYGEQYHYFNATYQILQLLIEKYYNQDWRIFMAERIFKPLGMMSTTCDFNAFKNSSHADAYQYDRLGHPEAFEILPQDQLYGLAACIYTNAQDMAKWLQFLLKKASPILAEEIFSSIVTPHHTIDPVPEHARYGTERYNLCHYGLGVKLGHVKGQYLYYHEGSIDGARSIFVVVSQAEFAATLLTNICEHDFASAAMYNFLDEVLGLEPKNHAAYLKDRKFVLDEPLPNTSKKAEISL